MVKTINILLILGVIIAFSGVLLNLVQPVSASQILPVQSELTATSLPTSISPPVPTPTINPESIGDTSGVISFGMIIVFVIIAGVIWGSYEYKQ